MILSTLACFFSCTANRVRVLEFIFRGVRVENLDWQLGDWPGIIEGELDCEIEKILGHYQAETCGEVGGI